MKVKNVDFMLVYSELEPLHHLTVVPEGCKATFFPYSGVSASRWGGRSPVENSAVASDIAERAPLGHSNRSDPFSFVNSVVAGRVPPAHSNRADRRDRWCEPFSAVASVVAGRAPPGHSNRADRRESHEVSANY